MYNSNTLLKGICKHYNQIIGRIVPIRQHQDGHVCDVRCSVHMGYSWREQRHRGLQTGVRYSHIKRDVALSGKREPTLEAPINQVEANHCIAAAKGLQYFGT